MSMMQFHVGGLGLFEFEKCRQDLNKITKDVKKLKIVSVTVIYCQVWLLGYWLWNQIEGNLINWIEYVYIDPNFLL